MASQKNICVRTTNQPDRFKSGGYGPVFAIASEKLILIRRARDCHYNYKFPEFCTTGHAINVTGCAKIQYWSIESMHTLHTILAILMAAVTKCCSLLTVQL